MSLSYKQEDIFVRQLCLVSDSSVQKGKRVIIKDGKVKNTDFTPAPIQPHPAVKSAPPLTCKTLPDGTDGRRILSPDELFELAKDPAMREAINTVERIYGCETMLKRAVRKQLKHDRLVDIGIRTQVRAIEHGRKKAKWQNERA